MIKCIKGKMIAPYTLQSETGEIFTVYGRVWCPIINLPPDKEFFFNIDFAKINTVEDIV